MTRIISALFMLFVVCLVQFGLAQFGSSPGSKYHFDFKPVVGNWAEYEIKDKGEAPSKMRIAVVGKEGDAYWCETIIEKGGEGKIITKALLSGDPAADQKNVKRMIVKTGNGPAIEIPVQQTGQGVPQEKPKGRLIDKGMETIKVPGGTFKAQHFQYQEGKMLVDTWIHGDVSPYGLVKSVSSDHSMILIRYGKGATASLTESAQKLDMHQFPQVPSKRR